MCVHIAYHMQTPTNVRDTCSHAPQPRTKKQKKHSQPQDKKKMITRRSVTYAVMPPGAPAATNKKSTHSHKTKKKDDTRS